MKNTIKKLLIITMYIGLIFISTNVYATSEGIVLNNSTRIRKEASTSSDIVAILSKNAEVKVISKEGEWYKVTYKSYTGYIRKDMLKVNGNNASNNATKNTMSDATKSSTTGNTVENNTTTNSVDNTLSTTQNEQTQNATSSNNSTESENNENETDTNTTNIQNSESTKEILQKGYKGTLASSIGIKVLPTINSSIIETLSENTQFTITDVINKWCYIETENNTGWVLLSKVESKAENNVENTTKSTEIDVETSQESEKEEKSEQEESNKENNEKTPESKEETKKEEKTITKYVSTETLNVRATPDNNAKIVTQLTLNTQVTIIEVVDNTWSKVSAKGASGYVANKFLSDQKTEKTSRSENVTRTKSEDTADSENTESNKTLETSTSNDTSKNSDTENTNNSSNTKTSNNSSTSSVTGASVVQYAKQYLGYKYVSGGTSPSTGFDCSGFTYYVYKHFGIALNRTSTAQISNGTAVSKSNLKEGDILIFNNSANTAIGHVGIYIGGNTFIHAANSSKGVITTSLSDSYYSKRYVSARRIIN